MEWHHHIHVVRTSSVLLYGVVYLVLVLE
jgi:hypothetical protein